MCSVIHSVESYIDKQYAWSSGWLWKNVHWCIIKEINPPNNYLACQKLSWAWQADMANTDFWFHGFYQTFSIRNVLELRLVLEICRRHGWMHNKTMELQISHWHVWFDITISATIVAILAKYDYITNNFGHLGYKLTGSAKWGFPSSDDVVSGEEVGNRC